MNTFPPRVIEKLKWYVYLYVDPRDSRIFYVGKGRGNRAFSHLHSKDASRKVQTLVELRKLGREPRIEILKYGLTEQQALLVEAASIDLLGVGELTNQVRGKGIQHGNRESVNELAAMLGANPVKITHPVVLINIARSYVPTMTDHELYDVTRSSWRVGRPVDRAEYALAVYHGVVREVYQIATWVSDGSTLRIVDDGKRKDEIKPLNKRKEFVGTIAEAPIRRRYKGRSVTEYLPVGAQNPIHYVNCDK